ncbi:hypothetical protein ACQ4WX_09075 [Streptomyces lasalocidi]
MTVGTTVLAAALLPASLLLPDRPDQLAPAAFLRLLGRGRAARRPAARAARPGPAGRGGGPRCADRAGHPGQVPRHRLLLGAVPPLRPGTGLGAAGQRGGLSARDVRTVRRAGRHRRCRAAHGRGPRPDDGRHAAADHPAGPAPHPLGPRHPGARHRVGHLRPVRPAQRPRPVAAALDAELLGDRAQQVRTSLADARLFRRQAAVDAFAHTPPDRLLTGLRGKDVLFTFVESYGRSAIEDPAMAPQIDAVLKESSASLAAAGFGARSGWLRSPVTGGGSWLAHATFLSGLWISNQQRFRGLTSSDRTTLTGAFRKTGAWRTAGIVPGVLTAWPEGRFFGLDHVYDGRHLAYHGPDFGWSQVPDQFALETFRRAELARRGRGPLMAEIVLTSSHYPWAPLPRLVDWRDLGDGSVFRPVRRAGRSQEEVWRSPESVRTAYRTSITYALRSLVQFLRRYGHANTVLVFLGDHQPVPTVTGNSPRKDVPVTIVARDPKVLDRISGWGWTQGLKPAANAPVWPMDGFRDRFLTAYGPRTGGRGTPPARPGTAPGGSHGPDAPRRG